MGSEMAPRKGVGSWRMFALNAVRAHMLSISCGGEGGRECTGAKGAHLFQASIALPPIENLQAVL